MSSEPWEYFCRSCYQLRLSFYPKHETHVLKCRNCGSDKIIVGAVGELDKAKCMLNVQAEDRCHRIEPNTPRSAF
jgi:Zn finger protein HypA/HybF involved in hydrogenase expression